MPTTRTWVTTALLALSVPTLSLVTADATVRQATTIELLAKRSALTLPLAPVLGLGFIGGGDLFDAAGTTKLGEGYSHCGIVKLTVDLPPVVTAQCTSAFRLADGELHLSSVRTYRPLASGFDDCVFAVIGGTGAYANARGEGKAARSTDPEVAYRFTFTVLTD